MDVLTNSIYRSAFDSLGGIKSLYLFPYVTHARSLITVSDQFLTDFPATNIFKVEGHSINFSEQPGEDSGSIKFTQNLSFTIPKSNQASEVWKLLKQNYRAIYVDNLGNIRILGLRNGMKVSYKMDTGTELVDLNGYSVTLQAVEENQAYYIDDLSDVGFTIDLSEMLAQENGCLLLQENNFEILL